MALGGGGPAHLAEGLLRRADRARRRRPGRDRRPGGDLRARCSRCIALRRTTTTPSRIANNSIYGLSGGGVRPARSSGPGRSADRIRTGTMSVNGGVYYGADVPFGGYKQSGIGREMGVAGFEEYLEMQDDRGAGLTVVDRGPQVWISEEQADRPGPAPGAARVATPTREYLDVVRREVHRRRGRRRPPTASPTRSPTSACGPATGWPRWSRTRPRRCSPGGASSAAAPSPCRSTPPTRASTCATSSPTPGPRCSSSRQPGRPGRAASPASSPTSRHVVVIGGAGPSVAAGVAVHTWDELLGADDADARRSTIRPSDLAHVHLHRRHDRPVEGLHAQPQLPRARSSRQIGICWRRTADDVVWTPLPLFHFNAIVTAVLGPARSTAAGRRSTAGSRCRTSGPR